MKTLRSTETFIPKLESLKTEEKVVILANTDYQIAETNMASGVCLKGKDASGKTWETYISPDELNKYYNFFDNLLTIEKIRSYLNNIHFLPSCVNFTWGWEITEIIGEAYDENGISTGKQTGFLINTTFQRPDIKTGEIGTGRGRRMWIEDTASENSVMWTAWLCVELIVKHELQEAFMYEGLKPLNPHEDKLGNYRKELKHAV